MLSASLRGAVKGAVWGLVALFPLTFCRYGDPLYTNWVGPGAVSYSGYYPVPSPGTGLTVSYRFFVEVVALYPFAIARWLRGAGEGLRAVPAHQLLWIATGTYYATWGACWAAGREPSNREETQSTAHESIVNMAARAKPER